VDDQDPFLYHKTTHRPSYDHLPDSSGYDDLVFMNQRGEVTESLRANLVVELDGELLTPPVESGLLPGVLRETLLEEGRVGTRVLTRGDVERASRIYLINAVRGWREAFLADEAGGPG
jgi:para-aminobenzoate synthetase/4-amino-4-deoxychorismate lyase